MVASLCAASVCLVMLVSVQTVLRFDLSAELGRVGRYVSKAVCYALTPVFIAGFAVETGRLLAA
ncbi:MAG TPA: hypothetical protein VEM59_01455 [Acidimicrobiia bacterium]|jgi:hypothetical protein|nr:hypothetical protein [Acidimicrobiia bacterium]